MWCRQKPRNIHVESSNGRAKFWLEPFVTLTDFRGLKQHEIKEIQQIVEEQEEVFRDAWRKHFSE
ncbi:MAG: DUF4160 domain-containing protein [Anaerolineales bacterium]|nr:DUF4160 domain-containing protein [Anaerolineales bacterium]